jgi:CRP/FNR family transcriptional regulator, cyclic AMP receptor protein
MTSSAARDLRPPAGSTRAGRTASIPSPAQSQTGLMPWIRRTPNTVSLLDADPGLGRGIDSEDWAVARQATQGILTRVEPGDCAWLAGDCDTGSIIGLIVNDGMISREISLGEHVAFDLLAPGDVLLVPGAADDELDLGTRVTLTALNRSELVVLSKPFIRAAARWPSLLTNLHRRLEAQQRRVAIQCLAAHMPRAEDRLLLTLWLLAQACGRVAPEGIVLPLSLSHGALGRVAAARRSTITLALRKLETAGWIQRRADGHLILGAAAEQRVQELTQASISPTPIGPRVALHRPVPMAAGRAIQTS